MNKDINQLSQEDINTLKTFKIVFEEVYNHVVITDIEGTVIFANRAVERITGYSIDEIIGNNPRLWGKQMSKEFYEKLWNTIKIEKKPFKGEVINKRKNGEIYYAIATITPIIDHKGVLTGFIGVEEDITKLKELDKMKDDFLSMASHELRTPLTAIKWFAERLEGKDTDKERLSIITKLQSANNKMINLVSRLLNISRIESGRIMVNSSLVDFALLAKQSIEEAAIKYKIKNQVITYSQEKINYEVQTDPDLVTEIMVNLITNSLKYSPEKSEIHIRLFTDDKYFIFEVKDNGFGIPKEQQKLLFSKFFRGDNILIKVTEGTGLGLYLSQLIAKTIRGKISFVSIPDKGSTFQLYIPKLGIESKKGEVSLQ